MATAWSAASKARLKSNLVRRDVSASEARSWVVRDIARTITDGGMDDRPNPGAQVREILIAHHPLVAVPDRPLTEPEPDATVSVDAGSMLAFRAAARGFGAGSNAPVKLAGVAPKLAAGVRRQGRYLGGQRPAGRQVPAAAAILAALPAP